MKNLTPTQQEKTRLDAVHHVVHDYANFVSLAEMVITGQDHGKHFHPRINSPMFQASLLNCRNVADLFGKGSQAAM
jgi:hypothetical protein